VPKTRSIIFADNSVQSSQFQEFRRSNTTNRQHFLRNIFNLLIIQSSCLPVTTIKRLKNTIADYDSQLIKASNIIHTFDQKKHDRFFLQTKLDTIKNILESRTLKANQLRDEVFDKPVELEELCATSYEFQDMYDQVVSSIRRPPPAAPRNLNLPVIKKEEPRFSTESYFIHTEIVTSKVRKPEPN
jgi:hypothetical protein